MNVTGNTMWSPPKSMLKVNYGLKINNKVMKNPKFKLGDKVHTPRSLYDEYEGIITKVDRLYCACDKDVYSYH